MKYDSDIRIGDRVALASNLDLWMAGIRYGTVESRTTFERAGSVRIAYRVRCDDGLLHTFDSKDLLGVVRPLPTYDRVHLNSCFADAVRSVVEDFRDNPNVSPLMFHHVVNGGAYQGYALYELAYQYLESGLIRCTCGAIPTNR